MNKLHVIDLHFLGIRETIAAFLIESPDGLVLIETGPHSTVGQIEKYLNRNGFEPEDIKHVLLSHIHLDHGGAAWYFAAKGATVYVHPSGYSHLVNPEKLMKSAKRIYQDDMDRLWGEMHPIPAEQLVVVEHQQAIHLGGCSFVPHYTPGHAIHHLAWQWDHRLFSGDVAGVKIGDGPVVPPCPPPDINIEDWKKSIELIRGLEISVIFLTHFGQITEIDAHLNQLVNILDDWADWMKPYFDKALPQEQITPLFQDYTKQQLLAEGLDDYGIEQYEGANPSWMSVAGLMRYWRKKAEREASGT